MQFYFCFFFLSKNTLFFKLPLIFLNIFKCTFCLIYFLKIYYILSSIFLKKNIYFFLPINPFFFSSNAKVRESLLSRRLLLPSFSVQRIPNCIKYKPFSTNDSTYLLPRGPSKMAAPTRSEALSLLRSLLRTARHFCDYNIREYTKRRALDGFRHNRNLSDPPSISSAYADGKAQLEVAKRQSAVYSLYAPKVKSIMEAHRTN